MTRHAVVMGAVATVAAALMACRNVSADGTAEDTSYRTRPGYVVDSVRPIEVDLARFRENLGPAPTELIGGGESLEALLRRFAQAVEARDSVALQRMQVSAAEFAWLIYPSSPFIKPPYQQPAEIAWMMLRRPSDVGLRRLLERRGGSRLRIVSHHCAAEPRIEGENKFWQRCTVTTSTSADATPELLFGAVVERHGHFKFASYQNQY